MKPIRLIIKKKWFDMIAKGDKHVEYREINKYYIHRFFDCKFMRIPDKRLLEIFRDGKSISSKAEYDIITFSNKVNKVGRLVEFVNGYKSNSPKLLLKIKDFSIGEGLEELGAVKGKRYFRIRF